MRVEFETELLAMCRLHRFLLSSLFGFDDKMNWPNSKSCYATNTVVNTFKGASS